MMHEERHSFSTSHTGEEHSLSIIQKLLTELTGYDGKISKEHSLSEDIGLESLDWLDFFSRLKNYTRSKLSNKQLNQVIQIALKSSRTEDLQMDTSLLSKLKVSHIQAFLDQQLYHPLHNKNFNYSNWKERFFPTEQSNQPVYQTWENLARKLMKGDHYLKNRKVESEGREMEILQFYWLHDELGVLVLEDALSNSTDKCGTIDAVKLTLANFLQDENFLYKLRLELAQKCLHHADNALRRIDNTGDDWNWVIEDFIYAKLNFRNLDLWLDFGYLRRPQNEEQKEYLLGVLKRKIIDFIRERLHQILIIWSSENNRDSSLNIVQQCHNYLDQQYSGFTQEFRALFHEEIFHDVNLESILKKEYFEFLPKSDQSNNQKKEDNVRFESLAVSLDQTYETQSKSESIDDRKSNTAFMLELKILQEKWRSPLNFLIRFPQLGSVKERISILMTTQNDWEKFLQQNIEKQSERLKIIFFASLFQENEWRKFIFENHFLKTVLNWQDLQLKLKKQDHKKLIERIEDVWAGIDLNIHGYDFPALEIFIRFGLKIFENDSSHKLFNWLSKPSDQDLINLTESNEIQSLSRLLQ